MLYSSRLILLLALTLSSNISLGMSPSTKDDELKDIELKISSAAEKKHQYSVTIDALDYKYQILHKELSGLQSKINELKINLKKTVQSEFILRNQSILKMLLENKQQKQNLPSILFYKKINSYQARKISEYLSLIHKQKNITTELTKNISSAVSLKSATQQEISNLKIAYTERNKILQLKQPSSNILAEIKLPAKPHPKVSTDKISSNPLEQITPPQISYIQKNRAIIHAEEGSKVLAINNGLVIFCGWMRGYGIIMIIDHGENLMSLYGHNQTTFKKSGDLVHKGEVISLVGKSGGHEKAGLYFEVRKNGISISLNQWLKLTG